MSLTDIVNICEQELKVMSDNMMALKQAIIALEVENDLIKSQLAIYNNLDTDQINANAELIRKTAQENLARIYEEGFHVCHIYFGKGRRGDCIFCVACLNNDAD